MKHSAPTFRTNSSFLYRQLCKNVYILQIYRYLQVLYILPSPWGGFLRTYKMHSPISQLSLCSQERLDGARTQLGVTPAPPRPTGREGAGQGSSSMAEGARSWLLAQLCHCQGLLAAPGGRCRLAHFQHPVLLLQQQSCEFRQSSSSRRCYFQKKNPQPQPSNICSRLSCLAQPRRPQSRQELLELPDGSLWDRSEAKST